MLHLKGCKGLIVLVYFCLLLSLHHYCCDSLLLVQWKCNLSLNVDTQLKFYLLMTRECDDRIIRIQL